MFFNATVEEKLRNNEKKMKELEIKMQQLSENVDLMFDEHKLESEALDDYFKDETNFSPEEWTLLQDMLQEQQKKIENAKKKVVDPRQTREKYLQRSNINPGWLFVR